MEGIMIAESPFYLWSMVEAWEWLIHVPALGFATLLLLAAILIFRVVLLAALLES